MDAMGYPVVSKEFETFDFEAYEQRPPTDSDGYRAPYYVQHLSNGIIRYFQAGENDFRCAIYYPNSSFFEIRSYYANGYIHKKGLSYVWGSVSKGIWYTFDPSGKLIDETDEDAPYAFTFEEVAKFCKKNEIPLAKGYKRPYGEDVAYIRRSSFEGDRRWTIACVKKEVETIDSLVSFVLDGKTGKVISKDISPYVTDYYR
jgi:hypothetical protein